MWISEIAKKLGVRAYDYIHDRVSGRYKLPFLAIIIENKTQINGSSVSGILLNLERIPKLLYFMLTFKH